MKLLLRLLAWLSLAALFVVSVVPAVDRPVLIPEHELEHALAFALAGALVSAAYRVSLSVLLGGLVLFAGSIEFVQIFVPTRHARLSDLMVDAAAICAGALCGRLVGWVQDRRQLALR